MLEESSEIELLKQRATLMGIDFHPNIGVDKLRERVAEKLASPKDDPAPTSAAPAGTAVSATEIKAFQIHEMRKAANKLVRVSIACMDPKKKEWEGETFSCGNSVVPTMKKYVPFNVEYHIPQMMLTMIEERQCQIFYTARVMQAGVMHKVRRGKLIKEFAVSKLDALTEAELQALAQRQLMAAGQAA